MGSAVEVRWIDLDDGERNLLRELGIREGAVLHIVNCGASGARVVALGSDRFAIDGHTCACIAVLPQSATDNTALVGSADLQPTSKRPQVKNGATTSTRLRTFSWNARRMLARA